MKTLAALLISCVAVAATSAESLILKATVPLAGVKGRFDHLAVDQVLPIDDLCDVIAYLQSLK